MPPQALAAADAASGAAVAQTAAQTASQSPAEKAMALMSDPRVVADTLWVLLAAMLVFWMNAGFACVETGLCRRKNAVNILSKNFIVFAVSTIAFWIVGFGLMFGDGNAFVGTKGFLPSLTPGDPAVDLSPLGGDEYQGVFSSLSWAAVPLSAKFFFQLVFAGTAATIVSGVVAERIKYLTFIIFSFFMVAAIYVVPGHWIWGGGWLAEKGFFDFAGSTVVHACGGWAGLAGALVLGARKGKFKPGGGVNPIPGHNMALAALGALILWLGWFGFNPGSTMAADPSAIGHIALTTNMAAATGAVAATIAAWSLFKKPDLSMTLNGCLAGLVAITAPCAFVSMGGAFIIGAIAGVIVVLGVVSFDKLRIDDPVGALSVHLLNGIFGTLAVGLFASPAAPGMGGDPGTRPELGLFYGGGFGQLGTQLLGVAASAAYVFPAALLVWLVLKAAMGVRVTEEEEVQGLDLGEHGMEAYSGFPSEQ
ncbi:MAG: ammonium transporter [Planctomycetes bacterium]|nr:ammonium transporter [Planctomycetota bacterium]